jgi:hypothetical protein
MRGQGLVAAAIAAGAPEARVKFVSRGGFTFIVLYAKNPYRTRVQESPELEQWEPVASYPDITVGMQFVASDVENWKNGVEARRAESRE